MSLISAGSISLDSTFNLNKINTQPSEMHPIWVTFHLTDWSWTPLPMGVLFRVLFVLFNHATCLKIYLSSRHWGFVISTTTSGDFTTSYVCQLHSVRVFVTVDLWTPVQALGYPSKSTSVCHVIYCAAGQTQYWQPRRHSLRSQTLAMQAGLRIRIRLRSVITVISKLRTVNLGLVSMNYIFHERNWIYLHGEDKVRS
jgi:hypothetical protein